MTTVSVTKSLVPRLEAMRRRVLEAPQEVSLIRALAITHAVKSNPGMPREIQLALGFRAAMNQLPVSIAEDERIVGSLTEKFKAAMLYPELKSDFIGKEVNNFEEREKDRFFLNDEEKRLIREEIAAFWNGKNGYDSMTSMLNGDTDFYVRNLAMVIMNDFMGANHLSHIEYEKVLSRGFNGILREIEAAVQNLSESDPEFLQKKNFYQSMIISIQAVNDYAARYAALALKMAGDAATAERTRELTAIADMTSQVPAGPARSFREAIQAFWFTVIALMHMDFPTELPYGRLDQILYPYYQRDLDNGTLTEAEAIELIEELFIKINRLCILLEYAGTKIYDGNNLRQTVTLGGLDGEGKSAVNPLSFIFLDAADHLRLIYPNIAVRLHPDLPEAFWERVIAMMTNGSNLVEVFNDELIIAGFIKHGFPVAESRGYIIGGCVQPIPANTYGPNCSAYINGPKIVEMVLNGGKPFYSMSGDDEDLPAPEFKTYEELWDAFAVQLRSVIKSAVDGMAVVDQVQQEQLPDPILSALTNGAVIRGKDVKAGGAKYNYTGISFVGIGTVTDSLAAIKELVFNKKSCTLPEMIEWTKADFEGYDPQRQMILNRVPKYGNDVPWVDAIAHDVAELFAGALSEYHTYRGGIFGCGLHSENHHIIEGLMVAATPDGRKAGERFSTGCGPTSGMDQNGPTATLHSLTSIDYSGIITGSSANMRFNPGLFKTADGVKQFAALLKAYFKLGGQHLQISVADAETLRDAQKHPQNYQDLIVRVVGYSARFVDLTLPLQEEIILRSEMNVCG